MSTSWDKGVPALGIGMGSMRLSPAQTRVLQGLIEGGTLKIQRHLDGTKVYQLYQLDGSAEIIRRTTVDYLKTQGLIDSNKKFPAATYLLTEKGKEIATMLATQKLNPLSSKKF
jgi:hypothetical protein